jgi:hypothetical protein
MSNFFKVLGFLFGWIAPFVVIYFRHVVIVDGYDVDMFGLLLILGLIIGFVKWVDNKIELWEIHKEKRMFILSWKNGKKILTVAILVWVLFTIEDNLPKLQWTSLLILFCFITGFVFTLLGNITRKKK